MLPTTATALSAAQLAHVFKWLSHEPGQSLGVLLGHAG